MKIKCFQWIGIKFGLGFIFQSVFLYCVFCRQCSATNWLITINMYTRACELSIEQLLRFQDNRKNWDKETTILILFSLLLSIWVLLLFLCLEYFEACFKKSTGMRNRNRYKNKSENISFSWCRGGMHKHYATQWSERKSRIM